MLRPLPGALLLLALTTGSAHAQLTLNSVFTDHMVLQREQPIHVWGTAPAGSTLQVALHGGHAQTVADRLGQWSVNLPAQPAGGPYELTVTGAGTVTLHDVLLGDLWIASGQSNMQFPMEPQLPGFRGPDNDAQEIAAADYPQLRLLHIRPGPALWPQTDAHPLGPWAVCTPASVRTFSAVAYFFGRDLLRHTHVPIGIIESDVGGTPAEAWTSLRALSADAGLMPVFAAWAQMTDGQAAAALEQSQESRLTAEAKAQGQTPPVFPWHPDPAAWEPAALFNGMIAPLTPLRVRGFLWYQGESNTGPGRAPVYGRLFRTMIEDWRERWGEGALPFLYAQISSFQSGDMWPEVREAQLRTLQLANTGMAVTVDVGEPDNIHPRDKQDVGYRLSLWARDLAYGDHVEDSGPLFTEAAREGSALRVFFTHSQGGLAAKGGPLEGFEVAGADGRFSPATATIDGSTLLVSSPAVRAPVTVRYGWASAPHCNLVNTAGLPASPFTSAQ